MPSLALMPVLALLLGAPAVCPPQEGQIHWDGFSITSGSYELRGTIWDRDTSGGPTAGDLVRIDEVLKKGRSTGSEAVWFLLGPGLAADFATRFRQVEGTLRSACESPVEIGKDMPTYKVMAALTSYLNVLTQANAAPTSPEDDLRAQMNTWAEDICKQGKHVPEKDLERLLVARAGKGLPKKTISFVAHEVATKFGFACTRVEGKFTFGQ